MMSWLSDLSSLANKAIDKLPHIRDQLQEQFNEHIAPLVSSLALNTSQEELDVGKHKVRIIEKLGEGGYSFVYLVEQVLEQNNISNSSSVRTPEKYALKKVLADGTEELAEARHEIDVMQRFDHINLLPLLDFAILESTHRRTVYMLFPLYECNVWDHVQHMLPSSNLKQRVREALHIFIQLCWALETMHAQGYCHRDVKPHNILLRYSPNNASDRQKSTVRLGTCTADGEIGQDAAHLRASAPQAVNNLPDAVLMDFGSSRAYVSYSITSRTDALTLQEDAERRCTAPYRAPELWDVDSRCELDATKWDSYGAGCVLYYMLVGETPFERAANESGGSLMLAVVNGRYSWPSHLADDGKLTKVKEIVAGCLMANPVERKNVEETRIRAQEALREIV